MTYTVLFNLNTLFYFTLNILKIFFLLRNLRKTKCEICTFQCIPGKQKPQNQYFMQQYISMKNFHVIVKQCNINTYANLQTCINILA